MRALFKSCLIIFLIVLIILAADILLVFIFPRKVLYEPDPVVGWRVKKNYSLRLNRRDSVGKKYPVRVTTNQYGFRAWGEVNTDKTKILFIGDSFTGDPDMSDGEAYFDKVKELPNVEVFAYGCAGYGTLQELMILQEYLPLIDPDILVLQ